MARQGMPSTAGTGFVITQCENQMQAPGCSFALNQPNILSPIFRYVVPTGMALKFNSGMSEFGNSFILDLFYDVHGDGSVYEYMRGTYQLTVYNKNRTHIKAILGRGALRKFGSGSTSEASLSDIRRKVRYMQSVEMGKGWNIELSILSPQTIAPRMSTMAMEAISIPTGEDVSIPIRDIGPYRQVQIINPPPWPAPAQMVPLYPDPPEPKGVKGKRTKKGIEWYLRM